MKNFILTCILSILGFIVYAQSSFIENTLTSTESSSVLFSKSSNGVKPTDCVGEWVSSDGLHLTLYGNNKAIWKDDGHIYYMSWCSEYSSKDETIKINLLGNDYCKHKSFYLSETGNDLEIVENQTNVHMYLTKEITATLQ